MVVNVISRFSSRINIDVGRIDRFVFFMDRGFLELSLIPALLGRQARKEYVRRWRERHFGPSTWHTCAAGELGWEELHDDR
jgi:hypothetical protein